MSAKDGIVHLWDLPEDRVCVKLPDEIQKEMVGKALSIISGRYNLAKKLNVKPTTIYDFERCRFQSVTLGLVKRLSNFLVQHEFNEFSLENIEVQLEHIKTKWVGKKIFNPKFPMDFNNKEGVQIVSGILFDGGITAHCYPFYTNNEENLMERIIKNVEKVVGKIECNKRKYGNTFQVDFPQILGYILNGLGLVPGRKVVNNPHIPDFILSAEVEIQKAFLQQAFDDEGTVNPGQPNGGSKAIQLDQYHSEKEPPKRLVQLKEMIEEFNIIVSGPYGPVQEYKAKRGYISYGWVIQITNQPNILRFEQEIGFSLQRKQIEMNQLLSSYKLPPRFKRGIKLDKALEVCKELKKRNEKITIKNIAKKLNKSRAYVSKLTCLMAKEGKLKVIKEKTPVGGIEGGFEEKEFELIE